MQKFTIFFLILTASFIFLGCPYNANVPLATKDTLAFDPRIIGHWKSPYLTAEINGIRVAENSKGQLIAIEFSMEKGKIKYDTDTIIYTPTKLNGIFFLDQKSDTAATWAAHPYFFSLGGNLLSIHSLNDTLIGADRKFASTEEYRNYVAQNIYKPRFLEFPEVMMRVTEGELNRAYIDLIISDTITSAVQKIAYAVRVDESQYFESKDAKAAQKRINKIERKIKNGIQGLRLDSIYTANDHGYQVKQFCLTAKNPLNLAHQKKALTQIDNIAIDPMAYFYQEQDCASLLNERLDNMVAEMGAGEFGEVKKVEQIYSLDPFEERQEAFRENALTHAMKIGEFMTAPYETIRHPQQLMLEGKTTKYWKLALYRIWFKE